jgi:hypothetical protein
MPHTRIAFRHLAKPLFRDVNESEYIREINRENSKKRPNWWICSEIVAAESKGWPANSLAIGTGK